MKKTATREIHRDDSPISTGTHKGASPAGSIDDWGMNFRALGIDPSLSQYCENETQGTGGAVTAATENTVTALNDIISGWSFLSGWTARGTGSIIDATSFSATTTGGVSKTLGLTEGKAYTLTIDGTNTGSSYIVVRLGTTGTIISTGFGTFTFTCAGISGADGDDFYIRQIGAGTTVITSLVLNDVTWTNGDTYNIYATSTKNSEISSNWCDVSRGWKIEKYDDVNRHGWKTEDWDIDDRGRKKVFGPGQPERK